MKLGQKDSFLIIITALSFIFSASAQVMPDEIKEDRKIYNEWGGIVGCNIQQLAAYPIERSLNPGANIGLYIKKRKKISGLMGALTVSSVQYTTTFPGAYSFLKQSVIGVDSVTPAKFSVLWMNIPVIAEIRPFKRLCLQMGVSYNFMLFASEKTELFSNVSRSDKIFKSSNFSAIAGIEYEITQKFRIAANYSVGFLDVNNLKFAGIDDRWMMVNYQLNILYRFKKEYPNHY